MIKVATTSLPAVKRPNADRWNAARSCQLVDLITKSNPRLGQDCGRENCLLCFSQSEKMNSQECYKRSIVYLTTCEEKARKQLQLLIYREKKKKTQLFKYIRESSRSAYEREWEHVNDMATLSSRSHMLKHAIIDHPSKIWYESGQILPIKFLKSHFGTSTNSERKKPPQHPKFLLRI